VGHSGCIASADTVISISTRDSPFASKRDFGVHCPSTRKQANVFFFVPGDSMARHALFLFVLLDTDLIFDMAFLPFVGLCSRRSVLGRRRYAFKYARGTNFNKQQERAGYHTSGMDVFVGHGMLFLVCATCFLFFLTLQRKAEELSLQDDLLM